MIQGCNSGLYVDTGLLRDHISKLREEKKLASRLYENIAVMKITASPMVAHQYDSLLRDVEKMIDYFDAIANQLDHIDDEAITLSYKLRSIIKDSTEQSQRITSENLVL